MMLARAVPDFDDEDLDNMISLFNAGWGVERLAGHFDMPVVTVRSLLDDHAPRRGRTESEAQPEPVAPRAARPPRAVKPERKPGRRADNFSPAQKRLLAERKLPVGEGLPKFANHDAHVAAVMAAGGFAAFSEVMQGAQRVLSLPLIYPQGVGA